MQAIRQFQVERQEWEAEREQLEARTKELDAQKAETENQLRRVSQELEQIRWAQASGPSEPVEQAAGNREEQEALAQQVESLQYELSEEQNKSTDLERRLSEAEITSRRLTVELDYMKELAQSSGTGGEGRDRPDMRQNLATKVVLLEDENLKLREELNHEKQRVIDLKHAAHTRKAQWKEELEKIREELEQKHQLEEELIRLRLEYARVRKELAMIAEKERRGETDSHTRVPLRRNTKSSEEFDALSSTLSSTGPSSVVEQELKSQLEQKHRLLDLFLHHALQPLFIFRRVIKKMAASGDAGDELWSKQVPPLFEPDAANLQQNLVKIVELLRFGADVMEAIDHNRKAVGTNSRVPQQENLDNSQLLGTSFFRSFMG